MLGVAAVLIALVIVAAFIHHWFKIKRLPPKAQIICDVWSAVESDTNRH